MRDLSTIKSFINGQGMTALFDLPWAPIYIVAIFFIHWVNGFITIGAVVVLLFMGWLSEFKTRRSPW